MRSISFFCILVLFLLSLAIPKTSHAIEGYPGSTWGELRQEFPKEGERDLKTQGWIRQGIDWFHVFGLRLDTYGTVRFQWDSEEIDYNNSFGPGLGLAFETIQWKGYSLAFGAEYLWDRYYRNDTTEEKLVLFVNWYASWDLKKH